jgi:hypothetical protein
VWYRGEPLQSRWRQLRERKDAGVLEVGPGGLVFRGKRGDIVLEQPRIVSVGLAGADTINLWITVEDRDGSRALFADGSRLGWGGVGGGTARLAAEIENAFAAEVI